MHDNNYKNNKWSSYCLISLALLFASQAALSLPIGFYKNQSYLKYKELKNKSFHLYYDRRSKREAQVALETLNQAKKIFEPWFQEKVDAPLPIIMSTETANASFANLITNALEVQTKGRGDPSLYVHEFTHHMMYRYFDLLGPSQITYHTAFLPNWWIEGLAEALSVSVSSAEQSTIERIKALTGRWPTYNSLHSLYGGGAQSHSGYIVSGGLTRYLFSRMKNPDLHKIHTSLRNKSLNPMLLVPFLKGTFDRTLEEFNLPEGSTLYKEYQSAALKAWQTLGFSQLQFNPHTASFDGAYRNTSFIPPAKPELRVYNDQLWLQKGISSFSKRLWAKKNNFKPLRTQQTFSQAAITKTITSGTKVLYYVSASRDIKGKTSHIIQKWSNKKQDFRKFLKRSAKIIDLYLVDNVLHWVENRGDRTFICSKKHKTKTHCYAKWGQPNVVSILDNYQSKSQQKLLIGMKTLTVKGSKFKLQWVDLKNKKKSNVLLSDKATITKASIAPNMNSIYAIVKEHNHFSIRQYKNSGECLRKWKLADLPAALLADNATLKVSFTDGFVYGVKKYRYTDIPWEKCTVVRPQQSMYLAATRNPGASFKKALDISNPWKLYSNNVAQAESNTVMLAKAFSISKVKKAAVATRFRHVTTVPWLIQDPFGLALGVLSSPLMDEMQNHEFRFTGFYGIDSQYASFNLQYINRRYWPTISTSIYRELRYNGFFIGENADKTRFSIPAYMDEFGGDVKVSLPLFTLGIQSDFTLKSIYVSNYYLPKFMAQDLGQFVRQGLLTTASINLSKNWRWSRLSIGINLGGTTAPDYINSQFEYNQIRSGISLSLALPLQSSVTFGVNGSRTRGTKMRHLKELYRPLITFVPGQGGGANKFHFNLADYVPSIPFGSIFSGRSGENQARTKADFNLPIIRPVDQVWGIAYVSRLDFSAFVNYGGAWNGDHLPHKDNLLLAHGYGLDLQLDIKGLNLNTGIGLGQVVGSPFDYYAQFGFDQIF